MPRDRRTPLFPIAAAPERAADSLGIRAEQLSDAIKRCELTVYRKGVRRRILVCDLVEWVRVYWKKEVRHARDAILKTWQAIEIKETVTFWRRFSDK